MFPFGEERHRIHIYIYIYMRSALVYQVTLQLSFKYGILSIFVLNVICKFIIPV